MRDARPGRHPLHATFMRDPAARTTILMHQGTAPDKGDRLKAAMGMPGEWQSLVIWREGL